MKRRTFLKRTSSLAAAPVLLNGVRLNAMASDRSWYMRLAAGSPTDKVLVIIQLEGGNDGLNMLVPVEDDNYYRLRPTVRIAKEEGLPIDGEPLLRMHPAMSGMQRLYNDGVLAVVGNIGYDGMNLSHFTGTEIWNTASGRSKNQLLTTGWIGRYLQEEYPDYPRVLPEDPPAIEINAATSSIFTVVGASIGMALTDPEEFYQLVNGGPRVGDQKAPDDRAGREWNYIDSINQQSQSFSVSVRAAANKAQNMVSYPAGNQLAEALAIIARLVAGGLRTRIYKVALRGFDTHGSQLPAHARLLGILSDAVKAFQDDLVALKVDHRVVGMTYSEFGRRVQENSSGTDHGTAAPHFVFGSMIDGGRIFGGLPDLANLDPYGNLPHTVDFHCYYASVLAPLFALDDAALETILPVALCGRADFVPLYRTQATSVERTHDAGGAWLKVTPNPARGVARMQLMLPVPGDLSIALFASDGRKVRDLLSATLGAGVHDLPLDLTGISSGAYVLHMVTPTGTAIAKLRVGR